MGRLFGTDGVRGVANVELTTDLAYNIGRAGAYILAGEKKHKPVIIIGKDTRISGDMLEAALIAGICSVGADVIRAGVIPTPGIAYLTRHYGCDAGVVISASHNSYEFNGIKFFNENGYKLSDEIEEKIEAIILGEVEAPAGVSYDKIGRCLPKQNALEDYAKYLIEKIGPNLKGKRIAIDAANGASYIIASKVFSELGAEVLAINYEPNGININDKCGSTHLEALQKYVVDIKADIGFAFDGDADRVLIVDNEGNIVDGDKVLMICGMYLKEKGRLNNNAIVGTIMSNLGLDIAAKKHGIDVVRTKVGDRYVLEEMLNKGYVLGGEQSGHIIFSENNTTGDGIATALSVLNVVVNKDKSISELAECMEVLPQVLYNAKIPNDKKNTYMENAEIAAKINEIENVFAGNGRVVIRPSGTEPLVRVMIEGSDLDFITKNAKELVELIESKL